MFCNLDQSGVVLFNHVHTQRVDIEWLFYIMK